MPPTKARSHLCSFLHARRDRVARRVQIRNDGIGLAPDEARRPTPKPLKRGAGILSFGYTVGIWQRHGRLLPWTSFPRCWPSVSLLLDRLLDKCS